MSEPTVRQATPSDIPVITRIYGASVAGGTASFELEPPDEVEMLRRYTDVGDAGFPYLVCERSGQVLGYAYLGQFRPRPAYRFSVENSIYVSPDAHRAGVGRLLLTKLLQVATERGYRQMIAVIGDSGQPASIGLHRAMGFTFCGTIHSVGFKHGRWLDSVIMQKALGAGDSAPPLHGR